MSESQAAVKESKLVISLLLVSGLLEILLGLVHNVVGSLLFTSPQVLAPLLDLAGAPASVLTPIAESAQRDLLLGLSVIAGVCWMVFGGMLVWVAFRRPTTQSRWPLVFILIHQISFLGLMLIFVRFHWIAITMIAVMAAALSTAIFKLPRSPVR